MSPCPFCRHGIKGDCAKHVKPEARTEDCPYFEPPEDEPPGKDRDSKGQGMIFGEVVR